MTDFKAAMRRIITGDDADGRSVIILDGGPSASAGDPDVGGLFEIWEDLAAGPLDPKNHADLGNAQAVLGPRPGNVQIRWFVMQPTPAGVPKETLNAATRAAFAVVGGDHHIIDQSRHSGMHETHSLDVICLLQGEVKLILEGAETVLTPGQVVIQRGTNHAWEAIGGPALLLAVLIDRPLLR
ncbi:MAG: hypothetical protein ACMVO5_06150 [Polymorphobacter sp.]|uniref:hypothetical protein n=1 Tax=Polymorphobacter sp. TaxID=1909290 RepID=UPI003A8BB862